MQRMKTAKRTIAARPPRISWMARFESGSSPFGFSCSGGGCCVGVGVTPRDENVREGVRSCRLCWVFGFHASRLLVSMVSI